MRMKALIALLVTMAAAALAKDAAQGVQEALAGWVVSTEADDFDGSVTTTALRLATHDEFGYVALLVNCTTDTEGIPGLGFIHRAKRGALSVSVRLGVTVSESVSSAQVKFDDEKPEKIGMVYVPSAVVLYSPLKTAKRLMVASKFAFRYFDHYEVTVRFDVRGADDAVGKVLAACGV